MPAPAYRRLPMQFVGRARPMPAPVYRRLTMQFVCLLLLPAACLADTAPKEACYSGLTGDFSYQTCGKFCKESKAKNHCRYCKCQICGFCPAGGAGLGLATRTPATKSNSALVANVAHQRKSMKSTANAIPTRPAGAMKAAEAVADAPSLIAAASGAGPRASPTAERHAGEGWRPWPTILLLLGMCCAASLVYMRRLQDAEEQFKPQLSFSDLNMATRSQGRRLIDEAIQDVERLEASQGGLR